MLYRLLLSLALAVFHPHVSAQVSSEVVSVPDTEALKNGISTPRHGDRMKSMGRKKNDSARKEEIGTGSGGFGGGGTGTMGVKVISVPEPSPIHIPFDRR